MECTLRYYCIEKYRVLIIQIITPISVPIVYNYIADHYY